MKSPFRTITTIIALFFTLLSLIVLILTNGSNIIGWELLGPAAFAMALGYLNTKIQKIQFKTLTSEYLIKFNIYLALIGVFSTVFVIGFFHLEGTEAASVATVGAEALGFIGLSLVELTVFLAARRLNRHNGLICSSRESAGTKTSQEFL